MSWLPLYLLISGIWTLGNGILHTVFVLRQGRPFEMELIRLMIDGLLLAFAGVLHGMCAYYLRQGNPMAVWVGIATSVFILGYCALIFIKLPTYGMMTVHLVALGWLILKVALPAHGTEMD